MLPVLNILCRPRTGLTFHKGENVRKLFPALLVAAVAVTGIGTPAMAAEATGPAIQWAGSIDDDLGRIQVSASSDAGVTGLTAHIVRQDTKAEVAVTTSFHLSSGTAEAGVWQSDEVVLPDLGYYTLNIEATDAAGGHTESDGIGTFVYAVRMYFADLKTTPTLTYTQRDYTVSGKLMGRWPGTGVTAPVGGVPVYALVPGGTFTETVTTGAKGQFSMSAPVTYADGGPGYVSTIDDPNHVYFIQGYSDLAAAKIKPAPTRVTVHLDRNSIVSGEAVTVSGDATWKSPNGWVPMPNAAIAIGLCPRGNDDAQFCFNGPTTSTDSNGHYSYVVNPYDTDMIKAGVRSEDIFVQTAAEASAKITVLMPTSFDGFYASRDADSGQVYVGTSGGLQLTGYSPDDTAVSVQFSKNGATGWHTVDTIDLGQHSGSSFYRAVDHPGAGYWRLTYAGVKGLLAPAQTDAIYVA
jgi:hypothetical protein